MGRLQAAWRWDKKYPVEKPDATASYTQNRKTRLYFNDC